MMDILTVFLRDHLHILLCVGAGCFLVVQQVEKRRRWPLRMAGAFLVICAWMMFFAPAVNAAYDAFPVLEETLNIWYAYQMRYVGLFALNVAAVCFYTKADVFTALFAGTIGYSIQHTCERMWEIPRNMVNMPIVPDRAGLILLMLLALYLYGRLVVWRPEFKLEHRFDRLNNKILLIIAAVVVTMNIVLDRPVMLMGRNAPLSFVVTDCVQSATISFMVLLVSVCHMRESISEVRADIADHLLHSQQECFARDKDVYDAINIKCHDIRHQIAALGEKGYRKQLRDLENLVSIYDTEAHSGNAAMDVVLSNKGLVCLQKGITFNAIADGRQLDFMADEDVYALFGNILDNAIEAAEKIEDPERRLISLTVHQHAGCMMINAENFYFGEVQFEDGFPVTSKDNKDYHGFGMQSIRKLTERYGGSIRLSIRDGIFRLSILLPIRQEKKTA